MKNGRNEGAFMRNNNRQPRKISDGRKSNNFMKYAKRFVKNMKRAWRRNVKPAIYATLEMLADKISGLRTYGVGRNATNDNVMDLYTSITRQSLEHYGVE